MLFCVCLNVANYCYLFIIFLILVLYASLEHFKTFVDKVLIYSSFNVWKLLLLGPLKNHEQLIGKSIEQIDSVETCIKICNKYKVFYLGF